MVSEVIMGMGDTKANVYTWKQSQVATSDLYYYNAVLDKQHSISIIQDYDSQLGINTNFVSSIHMRCLRSFGGKWKKLQVPA